MKYALIGDIHSSIEDLDKVLDHIQQIAPDAEIIGTGDIFECTISKKDITDQKFTQLSDVLLNPEGFENRLIFPTVKGNQEERIIQITQSDEPLREKLIDMPETISIGDAEVIHGHQWKWGGEPWALMEADVKTSLVFYGHSHTSVLTINGEKQEIIWDTPMGVHGENVLVNVGAAIGACEWVLYDTTRQTVTFYKA